MPGCPEPPLSLPSGRGSRWAAVLAVLALGACVFDAGLDEGGHGDAAGDKADGYDPATDEARARDIALRVFRMSNPGVVEPTQIEVTRLAWDASTFEVKFQFIGERRYYVPLDAHDNDDVLRVAQEIYTHELQRPPATAVVLSGTPGVTEWRFDLWAQVQGHWIDPEVRLAVASPALPEREVLAAATVYIATSFGANCSGTFISPHLVLTAAHCDAEGARVRLSTADGRTWAGTFAQHPEFRSASNHSETLHDMALVWLDEEIAADSGLRPLPVDLSYVPTPGDELTIAGFGKPRAGFMRAYRGRIESVGEDPRRPAVRVEPQLGGACVGVSGGPVVRRGLDDTWRVVGVYSGNQKGQCGFGFGVFTSVAPYAEFLGDALAP